MRVLLPAALTLMLALNACKVGPEYAGRPEVDHSATFAGGGKQQTAPDLDKWWRTLGSRELNRLVDRALANNLDVAIAGQRLREARAMRKQVASAILPQVGANASYSRLNPGTILGGFGDGGIAGGGISFDEPLKYWNSGIDIAWEIDVFGGRRREAGSALASEQAVAESLYGVRHALVAEVVESYVTIAGLREQLTAVEAQVELQSSENKDIRARVDAGASSRLDLDRSRARLETTRAQLPTLQAGITAQIKRLSLLLGDRPDALDQQRVAAASLPKKLPMARTGLPAELLLRRPDLREAERRLAAATEDIGVAVANFYPKFSIGNTGPTSFASNPSDLFNAGGYVFQFGPRVEWGLFKGGANRATLEKANARQKIALLEYEKAVLAAIGEVEIELANLSGETQRLGIVQSARAATADAVRRVRENHQAGASARIEVLIEEQALRDAEISEVRAKSQLLQVWIRLHKALGGGWK